MGNGAGPDLTMFRQGNHSPSYASLSRSLGDGAQLVDFCIPCNPYFPTPGMFAELSAKLETMLKFYPSDAGTIGGQLATIMRLPPQSLVMANGSTEIITWIDHLMIAESMATPIPTFGRWTDQSLETGKRVDMFPLAESENFALNVDAFVAFVRARGSRVAVVCNPNNPDGGYLPYPDLVRLMDEFADLDLLVIDESFLDFVDPDRQASAARDAMIRPNVLVLKSLGKNFGLHGIRFGYAVGSPPLIARLAKAMPKWNLNSIAETVVFMLKDHEDAYRDSLRRLGQDRAFLSAELATVPGLTVFPSQGNFVLVKLPPGCDGPALRDFLVSQHGVMIRECGNKLGITSQFARLVVRPRPDVERLLAGLSAYLGPRSYRYAEPRGTDPLGLPTDHPSYGGLPNLDGLPEPRSYEHARHREADSVYLRSV